MVGDAAIPLKPLTDTRLHRMLTIQEFLEAFDMYKSVICEAYAIRRGELDKYQNDIIDMSQRFGGVAFCEYHRAFSAKSAALLLNYNIKLDWSRRDTTLFCSIFSGLRANACTICTSVAHSSEFCPQINVPKSNNYVSKQVTPNGWDSNNFDKHHKGSNNKQPMLNGREICLIWNREKGCSRIAAVCKFAHVCIQCNSPNHPAFKCSDSAISKAKQDSTKPAPKK
jgi:hypothetical protein